MRKLTIEELGRPSVSEYRERRKLPIVVLLDNVRSLHNVGSAFRTCDAFGMERLVLTGITGHPPHREINKTALGATESVTWEHNADAAGAVKELKDAGYRIVVVEQTTESVPLHALEIRPDLKYCLVFGNEVHGVGEEVIAHADMAIEVPQAGTKHSLNISVCLGVVCWEFFKMHAR